MSLLGWYKLDSNFQDYSGNNNHGSLIGTSPTFVTAKIGNGAQFTSSSNGFIKLPISPNKLQGSFSISTWVNVTQLKNFNRICGYNWAANSSFLLCTNTSELRFSFSDGSTNYECIAPFTSYVNTFTHIICTCDGYNIKLYINGILIDSNTIFYNRNFSIFNDNVFVFIGSGLYNYYDSPYAIINDFKLYDHCLSDKEIFNLSKGLIAHYTFDGCLSDATGYNSDAKFYNNSTTESTPIYSDNSSIGSSSIQVMGQTNNQWVQLPSNNFLNNVTNDTYTLSCWCNIINAPPQITTIGTREDRGLILGKRGNHGGLTVMYDMRPGFLVWDGESPSVSKFVYNPSSSVINTWFHLVGTVNKVTKIIRVYANGVLEQTALLNDYSLFDYGSASFYIGAGAPIPLYGDGEWNYLLDLYIQDVKIYASELSASDVYNLYSTKASLDNSGNIYVYNNTEKYEATNTALSLTSNSVSSSIYSELGPTSGLIGYWPFKNDLKDYSSNNNHFNMTIGNPLYSGLFGEKSCIKLNDTTDLICNTTSLVSNSFTWTGWVYLTDVSIIQLLFSKYNDSTHAWRIFYTGSKFEFDVYEGEVGNLQTLSSPTINTWYFLTIQFDSSTNTMYLYQNGLLQQSVVVSGVSNTACSSLIIGQYVYSHYPKCLMTNYRYYNRLLTLQEIATIYDLENPNSTTRLKALSVEASISNAANTIFDQWYRFAHGSATTWTTSSTTSQSIGIGSKTFTITLNSTTNPITVGYCAYIYQTSNPNNYMYATVSSHTTTSLVVSTFLSGGSGTGITDWSIYIANENEKAAWTYNNTTGQVICQMNTVAFGGFISDKLFNNYTHEATLSSNNSDDDTIGLIIAFYKDPSWSISDSFATKMSKEYTLSICRDMGGSSTSGFRLMYNFSKADGWVVNSKTVTIYKNGGTTPNLGWQSAGIGTRIKVVRTDNLIEVWCTEPNTTTPYLSTTYMSLDLTSDSRLTKFQGYCSYGYCCQSQYAATFTDTTFTGTMCQVYPKNELKEIAL